MKRTIAIVVFAIMCMSILMGCVRFVPAAADRPAATANMSVSAATVARWTFSAIPLTPVVTAPPAVSLLLAET